MKTKILLIAFVALFAFSSFAQESPKSTVDLVNKKGEHILPEAGNYAIGIDASPFITYLGKFFSNTGGTCPTPSFINNQTIFGKYFVNPKTAYRGMLRIGMNTVSNSFLYDTTTVSTPAYLKDVKTVTTSNITLGAGIEKRKGTGRLQGYYGADGILGFTSNCTTYKYAESLSTTNLAHTNNFGQGVGVLKNNAGSTFTISARAFAGAEYFFLPKFSLGFEFGWGLACAFTGNGVVETESFGIPQGQTTPQTHTITAKTGGSTTFGLDTDNGYGKLALRFHF